MIEARTMQQRGERAACVEGADQFLIKVTNGNDRQDRALAPLVEDVIHPIRLCRLDVNLVAEDEQNRINSGKGSTFRQVATGSRRRGANHFDTGSRPLVQERGSGCCSTRLPSGGSERGGCVRLVCKHEPG